MLKYSRAPRRSSLHETTTDDELVESVLIEKKYIKLVEWPQLREVSIDVTKLQRLFAETDPKNAPKLTETDPNNKSKSSRKGKVEGAEKGWKDRSLLWLDIGTKKDKYRAVSGLNYLSYPSLDARSHEKQVLFSCLNGDSWLNNRGWVGRMKTLGRPEIKLFEAEASQYFGVISAYHRTAAPPIMALDKIITTIMEDDKGKKKRDKDSYKQTGDNDKDDNNNNSNNSNDKNAQSLSIDEKIKLLNRGDPIAAMITGLNLSGNSCFGVIPGCIEQFSDCEALDLSWNTLSGPLPLCVGRLSQLQDLDLSCNALSGTLPLGLFADLPLLKLLDLSFNDLHGEIPSNMFECLTLLEDLDLSGNSFHGILPSSLCALTRLQSLRLYSNQFSGAVPPSAGCLKELRYANLSNNCFTGGTNAFHECSHLIELVLSDNRLLESIAPSVANLTRLELLHLQNNHLFGHIPEELYTLKNLKFLNLSNNDFSGVISERVGDLSQLVTLTIGENLMTGPLPSSLSRLTHLKDFHCFKAYPSNMTVAPRGFSRRRHDLDFGVLPSLGMDCLCWDQETIFGTIK